MESPNLPRRTWVLTIQRFMELAWVRHGPARYVSLAVAPALVWLTTPGLWWLGCAIGAVVGALIDLRVRAAFSRLSASLVDMDEATLRRIMRRHVAGLSLVTACYVLPYAALAFAPQPGPLIGLVFCAGTALVCASLHVMTRTMMFYTIPFAIVGLAVNGFMLVEGWHAYVMAIAAAMVGANAIVMARAGAASFNDLIQARLDAEAALDDLDLRVKERTAQLAVATQRARAANRAKSVFLANMSHELRTPLNAVIGYSEIIEEDLESGDTRACADDLVKIRAAASHLLTLINEVLDLSRIEAGKLELKPAEFDLPALLRGALDTVKPIAAKNRTVCQFNVAGAIGAIHADETRLRQCVLNLLSNAAKFTQGGVIALEARPCRIGADAGVAISVKDTGPGISEENLARLFQPFMQVDSTKTRAHDGAGLGLVITRKLARAMGGDVQASSRLGHGATFTLYLPTRAAPARAAA